MSKNNNTLFSLINTVLEDMASGYENLCIEEDDGMNDNVKDAKQYAIGKLDETIKELQDLRTEIHNTGMATLKQKYEVD